MAKPDSVIDTLALERIEVNLFRGLAPKNEGPRIFGGLVIAQALLAAYGTVEKSLCHSIHCYFLRPGDPAIPILYEVDRARDGRSFTSRRVTAIQHGEQIFNLAASFQHPEEGRRAPGPDARRADAGEPRRRAGAAPHADRQPAAADPPDGRAAASDRHAPGRSAILHGRQGRAAGAERLDARQPSRSAPIRSSTRRCWPTPPT